MEEKEYIKGRGSQLNTSNRFLKNEIVQEHFEGIDEGLQNHHSTKLYFETPKKIVNKVESPDIPGDYSMNPYQGCEHGCIYCYARNTHEYWGFSAGLDFEQKIIVKKNAPEILKKQLSGKNWKVSPIMFSGNTDCYQPIEKKLEITRKMLEVLVDFKHPVSIITKNSLILRDLDLLIELNKNNLVHVMVSITTLNEELRQKLEPRTTTAFQRLKVLKTLFENGIPCGVMTAPIIPGLNSMEIPNLLKAASENGASSVGYTMVRLNGSIRTIFEDWLEKNFPDAKEKIIHQIEDAHGGKTNDSRFGTRMKGEGNIAMALNRLFKISKAKYFPKESEFEFNLDAFSVPGEGKQMGLF